MPACLRAGDHPVSVVVVQSQRVVPAGRRRRGAGPRRGRHRANDGLESHALTPGEDAFERIRLAPVDYEPVRKADLDDLAGEPAPVPVRDPLGSVLPALLVPVHLTQHRKGGGITYTRGACSDTDSAELAD